MTVYVAIDAQLGPIAVGYDPKQKAVHAIAMTSKKTLWTALQGEEHVDRVQLDNLCVRQRNVYIAIENKLWCFDLMTGQQKWAHRLGQYADGVQGVGLAIGDPYPAGVHGAILVPAGSGQWLYALDRESGIELWQRQYENNVRVEAADGLGTCVVRSDYSRVEIINPASELPVATIARDIFIAKPINGTVLGIFEGDPENADGGRNGIVAIDARTGQETFFDPIENLDSNKMACGIGGHVFAIRNEGAGIYVGPAGRDLPSPVPQSVVADLLMGHHALGVVTEIAGGKNRGDRRLIGLDPVTMAIKFDAGPVASPRNDDERTVATDNASFVVLAPSDAKEHAELRSFEAATGRPLWSDKVPLWVEHYFRGGLLVVQRKDILEIRLPPTGQVIASLKAEPGRSFL